MAKQDNNWIYIIAIAILLIAVIYFAMPMANVIYGGGSSSNNYHSSNGISLNPEVINNSYNVKLSLIPSTICIGDNMTGIITSNIKNGVCAIFYNTAGNWNFLMGANLNANGYFSTSQQINTAGTANFKAICCDASGGCKISNTVLLTVNTCPDNDNNNDDNSNDGAQAYCASILFPVSQKSCDAGIGSCSSQYPYCKFIPVTSFAPAHCACWEISPSEVTDCDKACQFEGYAYGNCAGLNSKNPCGINTRFTQYDNLCPIEMGNLHKACCCGGI